jgi:hypothetical protein
MRVPAILGMLSARGACGAVKDRRHRPRVPVRAEALRGNGARASRASAGAVRIG